MVRGSVVVGSALGAALGMLVAARAAAAQPVQLEVHADTCGELEAALRAAGTFVAEATARVEVRETGGVATIVLDDGHGRVMGPRELHAASCSELASSVAVVLEMTLPSLAREADDHTAIDAALAAANQAPADEPAPASDPEVPAGLAPGRTSIRTRERLPREREVGAATELVGGAEVAPAVGLAWTAALGMSGSLGAGAALGVRWRRGAWSLNAELAGERPPAVDVMATAQVELARFALAVAPCVHAVALAACAVVRAGFDRGAGTNLIEASPAVLPLLALGPRVTWELPLTARLALQLRGELDVALTSSQLDVDHVAVWRSNRFDLLGGAGVIVRFP